CSAMGVSVNDHVFYLFFFFFQAEDGIRDSSVTGVQTCALPICYIDEEIPHIASLMCDSVDAVVQHADVLVIGSASDEARRAVAAARPDQVVVDLTRSAATPPGARRGSRAGAR